jgi:hypothetical protein
MKDGNGFALTGGVSDYFYQPNPDGTITGGGGGGGGQQGQGGTINTGGANTTSTIGTNPNSPNGGGVGRPPLPGVPPNTGPNGGPWINGPFNPNNPLPGYGQTGSFINTGSGVNGSDPYGTFGQDGYAIEPKRTRWFNNILRSRERAGGSSTDTGQQNVMPRPNQ